MKEEWFVTFKLLFCEARYCPDHVVVRIRAFDLCRIRLGRGGGFSIALYIHWGVGIFDYSLYCSGLKSWRFVKRRAHYWPNHTGTYVWSLPVHSVNKVRDQMDRIPQCERGRERRDQRVFPQPRTQKLLFMGSFREHFGAFSVIFYIKRKRVGCQGHERIVQHFLAFSLDDKEGAKKGGAGRSKNFSPTMDTKAPFCRRRSQQIFCQ